MHGDNGQVEETWENLIVDRDNYHQGDGGFDPKLVSFKTSSQRESSSNRLSIWFELSPKWRTKLDSLGTLHDSDHFEG